MQRRMLKLIDTIHSRAYRDSKGVFWRGWCGIIHDYGGEGVEWAGCMGGC